MCKLQIEQKDACAVFVVKVVPGSSRTCVAGLLDGMLKVKVSAAAEKGKANKCLAEFLAKKLDVKKKTVEIISGKSNPVKQVRIGGVSEQYILDKLAEQTEQGNR